MTTLLPAPAVQVFNADYSDHGTISWQDAVSMILREAAFVLETHVPPRLVRSPSVAIEVPRSLMLARYVHVPYRRDTEHAARADILARDKHTCAYCGSRADTYDHVLPRSRGGGDTWFNLVAACGPCNWSKADRTPEEAGMRLLWQPYRPKGV
ncbi:endonuclease [Mycolicibacterium mageritense DSM 44476 = CIP 104973]|jgi:5-methylcytosine-specific restriction endonuclease McrA|uniref:HNH endonuclease family protein n=2 Tax=Mycolicibacterium TaxID=1866885 RepID=A0A100W7W3_MYCCR|nr:MULTISPECIES: HNH endonuclease [Mycolicibacterium]MCC9185455.1 HNH endonuclease [Mycolicibacterium mageritense]MCV7210786.1 HNH endonuclease [Mycolicibacterium canariasense]ORV18627.1 HNH endonuclease [Mycolicibacterium canariasense]CDO25777.1 HNH endonuclease [Mycolicibacterium mageritense DSM 44476 = CIP 104973]BBX37558.1 HNH endonuclease [Mycolicibacterium mageritense]